MRLLKRSSNGELSLTEDLADENIPRYAILSHTWGARGEEVTFQDLMNRTSESKTSYEKIRFCGEQAAHSGLQYFWLDTCCIDKSSSAELTEAINSMFRWYHEAAKCYVYLSDVSIHDSKENDRLSRISWESAFQGGKWFTRGWTLQELIAPTSVEFFSREGKRLGDKKSLEGQIHEITGIPIQALRGSTLSDFSVAERMAWAAKRKTTRKEDEAYSLLGIFDVHMPLIYGEREKAFVRLKEEIDKSLTATRGSHSPDPANIVGIPNQAAHPVTRNYRKVHVTIIHWEIDQLEVLVRKISDVFRKLYHYEVREIPLAMEALHEKELGWPWPESSSVDEKDLQIIYYLGSTTKQPAAGGFLNIRASPFLQLPDQCFHHADWLQAVIGIPQLTSDILLVLDCYIEDLSESNAEKAEISFLLNDDYLWARYAIIFAGYTQKSIPPGGLSDPLMSVLEDLAQSDKFYAREGLINSSFVINKLMRMLRWENQMKPALFGNDGRGSVVLAPV